MHIILKFEEKIGGPRGYFFAKEGEGLPNLQSPNFVQTMAFSPDVCMKHGPTVTHEYCLVRPNHKCTENHLINSTKQPFHKTTEILALKYR
jgi:hypothetical protein